MQFSVLLCPPACNGPDRGRKTSGSIGTETALGGLVAEPLVVLADTGRLVADIDAESDGAIPAGLRGAPFGAPRRN